MFDQAFVRISHGPRFSGILSTIGLFAAVACLALAGYALKNQDLLNTFIYAACTVASAAVFLDIRGVELDFKHRRVRQYRSFLGLRTGTWESIDDFEKVTLTWDRIQGQSTASRISHSGRLTSSDSYFVLLETKDDKNPFEIGEYASHRIARKVMRSMAQRVSLPYEDSYQKNLDALELRRLKREESRRN